MLEGTSTLTKHPNAQTIYVTIPATIARDSQFPFHDGETVKVVYDPKAKQIRIEKALKEASS